MKIAVRLLAAALLGSLLVMVASHSRSVAPASGRGGGPVVAVVGDDAILAADLELRIGSMPETAQANLEAPERQLELVDHMVDELLLVQAARAAGLDRNPELRRMLEDARRQLTASYYRERVLRPHAVPDSAYIRRYYAAHPEEFTVVERVEGRHVVLASAAEAREVRRLLAAGTPFETLLERSIDPQTRDLGGSIGIVERGIPVRGLGHDDAFVEALMQLGAGELSEPIHTTLGYHVVEIVSHDTERVRPLETVWESLARRLHPVRFRDLYRQRLDSLRAAYRVEVHPEVVYGEERYRTKRAEELFERARATTDPRQRIDLYQEILGLQLEPQSAAQARFMLGFVYLEELHDTERGRAELEQLLRDFPGSDLVDSARWMLDNLSDAAPAAGTPSASAAPAAATGGEAP